MLCYYSHNKRLQYGQTQDDTHINYESLYYALKVCIVFVMRVYESSEVCKNRRF